MSEMELLRYDEDATFTLADDAATVSAIVRRVGDERLRAVRFGEWTAKEVIGHLADVSEVFAERVRRCVEEEQPALAAFDPDALAAERAKCDRDAMELSRRLLRAHQRIVRLLARPGAADRPAVHGEWGQVTAGHLAAYQARHSREHVAALAAAFPPA